MSEHRKPYIDIVKGIAILLVVIGHCIQYGSGSLFLSEHLYFGSILYRAIYSFHMSLFMLISGFLFWNTCQKYKWKKILTTKFMSLGLPILTWGTVDFVIDLISRNVENVSIINIIKAYAWDIIGAPWFLWATLMCSIVLLLLRTISDDKTWILLVSIPIVLFIPDAFNFVWFKFMYPYFVIGYVWNKYGCQNLIVKKFENKGIKICALISLTLIWIVLLFFFKENQFIYTTRMQIIGKENPLSQLGIDLFRWLIGFLGSGASLIAISFCKKNNLLQNLGEKSLGIYLVNIYVNLYFLKPLTATFQPNIFVNIFLETVVVLAICFVSVWLLERNRILKMLLLGGR